MKRLFALAAILAATGVATAPAFAQSPEFCGKRSDIVAKLASEFKEKSMAVGRVDEKAVVEVFVSSDGTWTILATGTDGNSCVVSAGEGWDSKILVSGEDA